MLVACISCSCFKASHPHTQTLANIAGDGFVTDPELIASHRLSDPRPFFAELLLRPAGRRTLLAPHLYPPSVTNGSKLAGETAAGGRPLFDKLAASWGGLARNGFCAGGRCQRFPVVIGEAPAGGWACFIPCTP